MHETTNSKQIKVLVIEDNNDHWLLIEKAIQTCFDEALATRVASIDNALSLFEGCSLAEWEMPKLILLDLYLPTLDDGLRLLKYVKEISLFRAIPIIALSASNNPSDITKAYQDGVSSYCLKPNSFQEWVTLFKSLRAYWIATATLPPKHYSVF